MLRASSGWEAGGVLRYNSAGIEHLKSQATRLVPPVARTYEKKIAQEDKAIAKALLVPNLLGITEQGTTGSYAQSETQLEAFLWTLGADAKRLADAINEQLFRELGDYNFGDNLYPYFKFRPISDKQQMEIVKTWIALVTGKAVQVSDTDEEYLRKVLNFPAKGEVLAAPVVDTPIAGGQDVTPASTGQGVPPSPAKPAPSEETVDGKQTISVSAFSRAMKRVDFAVIANKADNNTQDAVHEIATINSAVVARLVALAAEFKLGTAEGQPNDVQKIQYTASEMSALKAAVNKGLKDAWAIGESHARREIQKAKGAAFGFNPDQERGDDGKWGDGGGGGGESSPDVIAAIKEYSARGGSLEQQNGATTKQRQAMEQWLSSGRTGDNLTLWQGTAYSQSEWDAQWENLTTPGSIISLPSRSFSEDRVRTGGYKGGEKPVKYELVGGMRGGDIQAHSVYGSEREHVAAKNNRYEVISWDRTASGINIIKIRSLDHATKGADFAVNDLALQDLSVAYLKQKSYTLAGDISAATQKVIRNILLEGIKVSKSPEDTRRAIYKALEADGMLTEEAVAEALGAGTVKNASARIDTAIRTTSFEAINEARYSFFSDPALDGFVEALEYSAILDDRTTEICAQLNGETYGIDDAVWSTFRPPNHFNCRSILIPVTIRDTWTPGEEPTVLPQKGFGFSRAACGHDHTDTQTAVLQALADNQKALAEAVVAMGKGEKNFTIHIDNKQGTKRITFDEATGEYVMKEEA